MKDSLWFLFDIGEFILIRSLSGVFKNKQL